jgi:hypothetical protein
MSSLLAAFSKETFGWRLKSSGYLRAGASYCIFWNAILWTLVVVYLDCCLPSCLILKLLPNKQSHACVALLVPLHLIASSMFNYFCDLYPPNRQFSAMPWNVPRLRVGKPCSLNDCSTHCPWLHLHGFFYRSSTYYEHSLLYNTPQDYLLQARTPATVPSGTPARAPHSSVDGYNLVSSSQSISVSQTYDHACSLQELVIQLFVICPSISMMLFKVEIPASIWSL